MSQKSVIKTTQAPAAIGPYSQGIKAGSMIFASGQIPLDPQSGQLIGADVAAQAEQVLKNLKAVLTAGGADFEHVVKTTIFLKDMNDFATVNDVYAKHFKEPFPARSTVEVARLPRDVRVEIEAIAKVPG